MLQFNCLSEEEDPSYGGGGGGMGKPIWPHSADSTILVTADKGVNEVGQL